MVVENYFSPLNYKYSCLFLVFKWVLNVTITYRTSLANSFLSYSKQIYALVQFPNFQGAANIFLDTTFVLPFLPHLIDYFIKKSVRTIVFYILAPKMTFQTIAWTHFWYKQLGKSCLKRKFNHCPQNF